MSKSNNRDTLVEITYPMAGGASRLNLWPGRDHAATLTWLSPDWAPGIRLDTPPHRMYPVGERRYRPTSRPLTLLTPRP